MYIVYLSAWGMWESHRTHDRTRASPDVKGCVVWVVHDVAVVNTPLVLEVNLQP